MSETTVKLSEQGRVSIRADLRRELGWDSGTELVEYRDGSRVVIEARRDMMRRMQDMAIAAREEVGGSGSVVDDLLAERRAEAAEEAR